MFIKGVRPVSRFICFCVSPSSGSSAPCGKDRFCSFALLFRLCQGSAWVSFWSLCSVPRIRLLSHRLDPESCIASLEAEPHQSSDFVLTYLFPEILSLNIYRCLCYGFGATAHQPTDRMRIVRPPWAWATSAVMWTVERLDMSDARIRFSIEGTRTRQSSHRWDPRRHSSCVLILPLSLNE